MFKIYDGSKYTSTETPKTCESEITGYEVRTISDEEIEKMGFDWPDENKEYLIVHYAGFDWNDEFVFIVADYYISRGYKGRHIENHEPQVLVGNEWVDHTKYRDAIRRMDERSLNGLITDEE